MIFLLKMRNLKSDHEKTLGRHKLKDSWSEPFKSVKVMKDKERQTLSQLEEAKESGFLKERGERALDP